MPGSVLNSCEGGLGGVGGWEERVAEEEAAEGVEVVFAGCGDIAPDAAEVLEVVETAEGA